MRALLLERASDRLPFVDSVVAAAGGVIVRDERDGPACDLAVVAVRAFDHDAASFCERARDYGLHVVVVCGSVPPATTRPLLAGVADDAFVVPFDAASLVTRLRELAPRPSGHEVTYGPFAVDRRRRVATLDGRKLLLTARELDMLLALVEAAGNVVTRDDLQRRVSGESRAAGSNVVDVYVSRLRAKLRADAPLVETVRGGGYRLRRI